ncbi:MAG: helix-turn-helix transcriptional regulator [Verrucomicrobiota bacterium]
MAEKVEPHARRYTVRCGIFVAFRNWPCPRSKGCRPDALIHHSLMLTGITVIGMMAAMKKTNPSFLNGVPELLVLRLLARREMYGYQIVEEIRAQTKEAFSFGEGCIYPYLHYLEAEKQVSSQRREVEGRNRNYYKLTARGRKRLEALTTEWKRVTTGVSLLMEEQHA